MLVQALLLLLAIFILYIGAEAALNAAERVGKYFGLSPLVIGLLIVGFGTSLPEFFVSQLACLRDHSGIALGNIVGSNVANLFLILGVAGLLAPLKMNTKSIKNQFVLHLVLTTLLAITLVQSELYIWSSLLLVVFFVGYLYYTSVRMKKYHEGIEMDDDEKVDHISFKTWIKLFGGFVFLYFGGELLVSSGSKLGEMLGISSYVISAVFVAFGTSFPELVTALVACFKKKHTDLITGNIIGSNIFNVAFVLASLGGYSVEIAQSFVVELSALFGAAIFLLLWSFSGKLFFRFAGALFLATYGVMVFYWVA